MASEIWLDLSEMDPSTGPSCAVGPGQGNPLIVCDHALLGALKLGNSLKMNAEPGADCVCISYYRLL